MLKFKIYAELYGVGGKKGQQTSMVRMQLSLQILFVWLFVWVSRILRTHTKKRDLINFKWSKPIAK